VWEQGEKYGADLGNAFFGRENILSPAAAAATTSAVHIIRLSLLFFSISSRVR
jgi:hypothetical protein